MTLTPYNNNNAEQNLDGFSLPTPGTLVKITNYHYYTREVRASVRQDSVECHALDWADPGTLAGVSLGHVAFYSSSRLIRKIQWKVQELPDGSFAIETHGKLASKDLASGRLVLTSSPSARQTSASTWNLVPFHPGSFA